eukprot:Lankesteria_metandrocarpae@DN5473_c0_g1_i11.p1
MHRSIVVIVLFVWATTVLSNVNASTITQGVTQDGGANPPEVDMLEDSVTPEVNLNMTKVRVSGEGTKTEGGIGLVICLGLEGDGMHIVTDHGGDRRLLEEGETNLPEATAGERNGGSSPMRCEVGLNRSLSKKEKAKGEVGIVNCLGLDGDGESVATDHGGEGRFHGAELDIIGAVHSVKQNSLKCRLLILFSNFSPELPQKRQYQLPT